MEIVRVALAGGGELYAEIEEPVVSGRRAVAINVDEKEKTIELGQVLERIKSTADQIAQTIGQLASAPDGFEVKFGVKLSASLGAVIAKASTEANFEITLKWAKAR